MVPEADEFSPAAMLGSARTVPLPLALGHGGRQGTGGASGLKADFCVSAVAERLVLGLPAAAQPDSFAVRDVERVTVHVVNGKVPFDADGTVVANGDFCWHFS